MAITDSNPEEDAVAFSQRMGRLSYSGLALTSRDMIITLRRLDGRLQQGDVVAMMMGMPGLSVIRPTSASCQEYTFVGACEVLYGRSQFSTPEECFAQNEVQEIRLV